MEYIVAEGFFFNLQPREPQSSTAMESLSLLLFREPGYSVTSHVTSPPKAEKGDRRLANINVCIIHFHLYKAVVKPELQNQEKCLIIVLIPIPYIQLKFIRGH